MRKIVLFVMCAMLLLLASCKSKKVLVSDVSDIETIDTTKAVKDTANIQIQVENTTKTIETADAALLVEFVDSGGNVSIGPDGAIKMDGVKNVRGQARKNTATDEKSKTAAIVSQSHNDTANGKSAKNHNETVREEKPPESKLKLWLIIAGLLALVAVLIKILIKRKS